MKSLVKLLFIVSVFFTACSKPELATIDLSGEWTYRLDSLEKGEEETWYNTEFTDVIDLPGALRDYRIGNIPGLKAKWTGSIYDSSWFFNPDLAKYRIPGDMKFPFWLTPVTQYVGMAWYQKSFTIPQSFIGKDLVLFLERPHWQTTVWFDNMKIGADNSLSTPHQFIVPSEKLIEGNHKITIRVDNAIREIDPGINSHSITDHTQGNWNGITGKILAIAKNNVRFDNIRIQPDLAKNKVKGEIRFSKEIDAPGITLNIEIAGKNFEQTIPANSPDVTAGSNTVSFEIPMGTDYKTWSEFTPDLYTMKVTMLDETGVLDTITETFGMREFTINDKHFEINGIPVFLRGTTECCVFPLTGYPPTNEAEWTRIYKICKSFGLNHMRFHSYCPPEAAFIAADKEGIYLQVEGPSWAKYSTTLGNGKPIDAYLMEESKRIIDTYGNHPSFCMMAYGNEPSGNYVPYLENWVDHFRAYDPQRVFTGASTGRSWAIIENSDFIVRSPPRGLNWKDEKPESFFDYRDKTEGQEKPYVSFEMGQWCVFPNFKEIDKYTGSLKAKNFEMFREDLNDKNMGSQAEDFLMASGKLQASCYKQEIEATMRTPNLAGFQLLSLNDFSGQGTALVGVLDAFWDEKGYITADEFKAFCNRVVPLVRLPKFTYESTEILKALVEIANFSGAAIEGESVNWKLTDNSSKVMGSGNFVPEEISVSNHNEIGEINLPLDFADKAGKYVLSVSIGEYENHWNIWIYDGGKTDCQGITIANKPDDKMKQALANGEKVLLLADGNIENGKDVVQYLVPAFWNTSWFKMRPPHTTGILIRDKHPVFNDFPTDFYSDLQWWELCNRQQVMNMEYLPADITSIVQPIDTWFINRKLSMLFEAKVGKGKLIVCSMDLINDLENRPVANQLRNSILQYMNSTEFNPESNVDWDVITELFEVKDREGWNSYVNATP